ncbi:LacI family DNA-binding transcriptional regulator [Streptomyces sp. NPDC060011]|uniref:LacI family DNA-binding transcriptional regulator n=1 Tax=unclassified Streptomyces TaxID=2593676 RepID=UPI0019438198|nr:MULTISPECIES: LacI family DNA-binding transcriptional regulator [unclassified Streptomyces]MCX5137426.1 LacI family transcriptional regulator [Streptomyces sp. NBC_00340]WSD81207.1 LacI family transcriptional regulator [Streptomyces sp. NBC_01558]WSK64805.1 LacI family transcriptional regulator [Streptomyces sp. NBC_01281]
MAGSEQMKRVTITDVAQHAGVSTAAVSKVLRNAYGVSAAMQEKVRAAMADLNYRPHAAARGMRGRTYTIGVLLDNIRNSFFADILDGVQGQLDNSEYTVMIGAAGFGADAQGKTIRSMVDRQMDGLILIAPGTRRSEVLQTARITPTVVIGHHDTSDVHDSVADADAAGAGLVVDHLVGLGHRNIALVSSPGTRASQWHHTPEIELTNGYTEAMEAHGLAAQARVSKTAYSDDGGYKAGISLLAGPERPTAIMAGADVAALGVWRAARELGLRVPEDVSLVGYNNTTLADLATVQLTSVDQAGHDMGSTAARLLIERVEGRRDRAVQATMTPRLITRESTSAPRTRS